MLCLIQSRLTSKRLPNKSLIKINKKEILLRVIDQIKKCKKVKKIYVLIPDTISNKKIEIFLKKKKINFFKGSENNVFDRFYYFLSNKKKFKSFIRISADSPLIDPNIISKSISLYNKNKNYDLITNVFPRTFPKGQSVEIVNSNSFLNLKYKKLTKYHKEHVTSYFYDYHKKFKIKNLLNFKNQNKFDLSVDTKKDLVKISRIINSLEEKGKKISLENIC